MSGTFPIPRAACDNAAAYVDIPRWHRPAIRRSIQRIHAVLDGVIESYRARGMTAEASVIGRLLDARDEETGAPLDPEALARLHAELDTVLGDRPPTLADVPRLVYTRAVFATRSCGSIRRW
ncbi:MAG TPA: hypothetical protein VMM79_02960 [Longimicrobiales bacterium]|nr:hypothetical protein [Longimicrobiales bacterium]